MKVQNRLADDATGLLIRQQYLTLGFLWTVVTTRTFEEFVDARQIAIAAIATFASRSASRSSFLPPFVQDGLANLFELFVFTRLHA